MLQINRECSKHRFLPNEDGAATPWAIILFLCFMGIGGLAVDFNKAISERTQMQTATDSAAHAAAYKWEFEETTFATTAALELTQPMLPEVAYRDAILPTDIEYGFWDPDLATFTVDPTFEEDKDSPLRGAVRATARLETARLNASNNILLDVIGWGTFDIDTRSIYSTYYPPCFTEGFVAQDVVNMQSNSNYLDGFCMHSNTYVSLNQNNFFEAGTVVSMPNLAELDIPESGFEKNEGLQAALRKGRYNLRILRQMPQMYQALRGGEMYYGKLELTGMAGVTEKRAPIYPLDITHNGAGGSATEEEVIAAINMMETTGDGEMMDALPRMDGGNLGKKTMSPMHFKPRNRIFRAECSGNGDITMAAGHYEDFVMITDCPVNFANGAILDGVLIATEADVDGSHVQIGMDDKCADGGNAAIWTMGSFRVAAGMQGYGAQILAWGDIEFAAQANGIEGVSFISYGTIDGTSENDMGYCDGKGTDNFAAVPYYRMVQ